MAEVRCACVPADTPLKPDEATGYVVDEFSMWLQGLRSAWHILASEKSGCVRRNSRMKTLRVRLGDRLVNPDVGFAQSSNKPTELITPLLTLNQKLTGL